jgi:hypothetical protein
MAQEHPSVADIFRRAQEVRKDHVDWSHKQIADTLLAEFKGRPLPSLHNLTIPEQDARAPEEDWSAGLPIVSRGIQTGDWKEIVNGILLSFEQTETYERERGPEGDRDSWHDRNKGIEESSEKALSKWLPEELMKIAEDNVKK